MEESPNSPTERRITLVPAPKQPYAPPKLVTHGRIDEITGGVGTKPADIPLGSSIA
jgi:hypothetical protein